MAADQSVFVSIAAQIPVVVLFAWFILRRDQEYREDATKRDLMWQKAFERMMDQNAKSLERVAENLAEVSRQLSHNTVAIIYHDATVRGVNPETLGSTEDLIRKVAEK